MDKDAGFFSKHVVEKLNTPDWGKEVIKPHLSEKCIDFIDKYPKLTESVNSNSFKEYFEKFISSIERGCCDELGFECHSDGSQGYDLIGFFLKEVYFSCYNEVIHAPCQGTITYALDTRNKGADIKVDAENILYILLILLKFYAKENESIFRPKILVQEFCYLLDSNKSSHNSESDPKPQVSGHSDETWSIEKNKEALILIYDFKHKEYLECDEKRLSYVSDDVLSEYEWHRYIQEKDRIYKPCKNGKGSHIWVQIKYDSTAKKNEKKTFREVNNHIKELKKMGATITVSEPFQLKGSGLTNNGFFRV